MNDIIRKSFKRKNSVDSDIFIVESVENDFITFVNGARCKTTTLLADFEEINTPSNIQESELNAETFFNSKMSDNDPLISQLDDVVHNPNLIVQSEKIKNSVSLDNDTPKPVNYSNDNIENSNNIEKNIENRLPEWDVFDRVKKSEEIEIEVLFKIQLPKAQKIDALNDMFETSFIAYLAKQYIANNIANNTVTLQLTIKDAIEKWVDETLYSKVKPKSKTKTKTKAKSETKSVALDIVPVQALTTDSVSDFFNKTNNSQWTGDVKNLLLINTDEQYTAVKNEIVRLLDINPESIDILRYEKLINIYEEQLNDLKNKMK